MQLTEADARLRDQICTGPHWTRVTRLGVAVSGGGDSMALLHLLAGCAAEHGVALEVATVDHGLRPEAADEAAFVADTCQSLDIPHETLFWMGWDGTGNLQAEARSARYRLLGQWAQARGLDAVALGHTLDDQAETFLMRLAREAGVDGLAAMDRVFARDGAQFWRPALALERAELRDFLASHGLDWHEDPSNDDARFDRVKARRALAVLEELGIDKTGLWQVAGNLGSASHALKQTAQEAARRIAPTALGDVLIDRGALLATPNEIQRRLIGAALVWVSGALYPPRREALMDLERAIIDNRAHTLHGCLVTCKGNDVRITREYNAVKDLMAPVGSLWDNRWRLTGPDGAAGEVRALGEAGLRDCPNWRETGLPRASLLASPAVWQGDTMVSAPLAGEPRGWVAQIGGNRGDFHASVLSH